jgi:hypothetical protein
VHAFYIPALAYSASGFIPPEQLDAERQAKTIFDTALKSIGSADAAKVPYGWSRAIPPSAGQSR